jgi:hypothetical protein
MAALSFRTVRRVQVGKNEDSMIVARWKMAWRQTGAELNDVSTAFVFLERTVSRHKHKFVYEYVQ